MTQRKIVLYRAY